MSHKRPVDAPAPGFGPLLDAIESVGLIAGVSELILAYAISFEYDCESTVNETSMRFNVTVARPDIITLQFFVRPPHAAPTHSQFRLSFRSRGFMANDEFLAHHDRMHARDAVPFSQWRDAWIDKGPLVDYYSAEYKRVFSSEVIPSLYRKDAFATAMVLYEPSDLCMHHILMKIKASVLPWDSEWCADLTKQLEFQFSIFGRGLAFPK